LNEKEGKIGRERERKRQGETLGEEEGNWEEGVMCCKDWGGWLT
jgi:hypothetical protein